MVAVIDNESFCKGMGAAKVLAYSGNDDPTHAAVVLATAKVGLGGGPATESLVFLASDGEDCGHVVFDCDGKLKKVRLSLDQAGQLLSAAKGSARAARKIDKDAETTVELSVVDSGATLLMRTLTDGAPGEADSRHYVPLLDIDEFPLFATITKLASKGRDEVLSNGSGDDGGGESNASGSGRVPLPAGNLREVGPDTAKKIAALAGVFKEPVQTFALGHPASRLTITCAGVLRASLAASVYAVGTDTDAPEVPVALALREGLSADDEGGDGGDDSGDGDE